MLLDNEEKVNYQKEIPDVCHVPSVLFPSVYWFYLPLYLSLV